MKIKLDENLPESLVATLASLKHDADNVRMEKLTGHPDADIWQAAQSSGRFLVTQDLDFSDVRKFAPGHITACCCCDCNRPEGWLWQSGFWISFKMRTWPHGRDVL